MSRLYTKSGDGGFTSLSNGKKVKKNSDIIELYGSLDELNVFLAHASEALHQNQDFDQLLKSIYKIQKEIFNFSSKLMSGEKIIISSAEINKFEDDVDAMSEKLPILKSFILPGGGEAATRLHLARVTCRRVERVAFRLLDKDSSVEALGVYLNRLSDWLYVGARTAALIVNAEEVLVEDL